MGDLYHFTNLARLPWIVAAGELQIGNNRKGDFPDPDPLWATTDARGDRTATGCIEYFKHHSVLVRMTLDPEDFGDWREVLAACPEWTSAHMDRLAKIGLEMRGDPTKWRARLTPLPLAKVKATHIKKYSGSWETTEIETSVAAGSGIALYGEHVHLSMPFLTPTGVVGYHYSVVPGEAFPAFLSPRSSTALPQRCYL